MQFLEPGMARIHIKDLRLRTYIGINEDEIRNKQDIVINVTLFYCAEDAVRSNSIEHALNYRTITKEIIEHVETNRFALLERLTQEVLEQIMTHQRVQAAQVEIDKPHALRFSDSVSVTLHARRGD
ncbi:MAG TPA: dihydroneopterin triphosphate 2'-epimerase [Thiopseudomonas sp.]|nr:dihydroneopterin triphosphate 2'-epimerase [Thiopseudomonas sp.]